MIDPFSGDDDASQSSGQAGQLLVLVMSFLYRMLKCSKESLANQLKFAKS